MESYLSLQDVSKTFGEGRSSYTAIEGVNLDIAHGEFITFIGHSGCGKSTLLSLIAGLILPTTGNIYLEGSRIIGPGPDRGMVFQHHALLPWLTVYENVYHAVDSVFPNSSSLSKRDQVGEVLDGVGLWAHREKKPHQISGGMKQRTAVARAFSIHPKLLLMDEPFGALDALTRGSLQEELIKLWNADKKSETVIMVTHDIDEAILLSDRIVVMTNGPAATIAEVVDVPILRPREKSQLVQSPEYAELKVRLPQLLTSALFTSSAH